MRIAVIGCGRISKEHLAAIRMRRDKAELTAVVDLDEERAKSVAEEFGAKKYYTDTSQLFADGGIEGVDICLPVSLHAPVAVEAARAGKHVLVEKPMAMDTRECDWMIAEAEKNNVTLMVGQSRRFNGPLRKAKAIIDSGRIGSLFHISYRQGSKVKEAAVAWWNDPEVTGRSNMLYNWGSHIVDQILWVAGGKPDRVYAEGLSKNPAVHGFDELAAIFGFNGELLADYQHSYNNDFLCNSAYYLGTNGTVAIQGTDVLLDGATVECEDKNDNNFADQLEEFVDSVKEGREPLTSGRKIRPVVEVMDAIIESVETHRMVNMED